MTVIEKKETLVLLHGWGCDSNTWSPILAQLQFFADVLTIDLPGFGASAEIDDFSLTAVVDLIAAQLPNACVLIGWSLGGMLAVQIAVRYPQKVSRIMTLASNAKFVASRDYPDAMPLEIHCQFTKNFSADPHATLKVFRGLLTQGDINERVLSKNMRTLAAHSSINKNWLQALQLLTTLDNREAFPLLTQSGLHLLAECDALVPATIAAALAALNNQQQIHVIARAAHALHWSQPETIVKMIHEFLQQKNQSTNTPSIDKKRIAQSFSRAANTYDAVASLQRDVGDNLLNMIEADSHSEVIVDLGCGTGYCSQYLQQNFPQATIIGIDLAEGMLAVAQQKNPAITTWLCADAENLPLACASVDNIFSNLALQWCDNLPALFSELNRVLKPNGKIIFSTLGPNTLHELKAAWQQADHYTHVNQFKSAKNLQDELHKQHFFIEDFSSQQHLLHFEKLSDLTRELKALGAHNLNADQLTGLTGRKKIAQLNAAYENFRCDALLPATYDIFYISAKKLSNVI